MMLELKNHYELEAVRAYALKLVGAEVRPSVIFKSEAEEKL